MSAVTFEGIQALYDCINVLHTHYIEFAKRKASIHAEGSLSNEKASYLAKKILDSCFLEFRTKIQKEYKETDYKELMEISMKGKRIDFYLPSFQTELQKILKKQKLLTYHL